MKQAVSSLFFALLVAFCLLPQVSAQELVIEQRQISAEQDALYGLLGDDLYAEMPSAVAGKIFALPIEDILAREGQGVDVTNTTIYVKGTLVRMGEEGMFTIIDMKDGSVKFVNTMERSYMEWGQNEADEMESKMNAMMEDAGYSAEDMERMKQEMMEEASEEYGDDDPGEAVGSGKKMEINGMTATSHESNQFGVITVSWCAPGEAGLADAFRLMSENAAMMSMGEDEGGPEDEACKDELPVREQTYDATMNSYVVDEIVSVRKEAVSADLFKVPAGFTKQAMPF